MLCADAAVERPDTPRREAPRVAGSGALSALLAGHFVAGGQPEAVDSMLVRAAGSLVTNTALPTISATGRGRIGAALRAIESGG